MLSEYKKSSNNPEMFQYLIGEKIVGAFQEEGNKIIVFESGAALIFNGDYWNEPKEETDRRIRVRKEKIEKLINEFKILTTLVA